MKDSMYTALSRIKFRCVRMKDFMRYLLERYEEAINRFIRGAISFRKVRLGKIESIEAKICFLGL